MVESKVEMLANSIQLYFFMVDALRDGVEIEADLIDRAEESLPKIQQLLKEIETEKYKCDERIIQFGELLLEKHGLEKTEAKKLFEEWKY